MTAPNHQLRGHLAGVIGEAILQGFTVRAAERLEVEIRPARRPGDSSTNLCDLTLSYAAPIWRDLYHTQDEADRIIRAVRLLLDPQPYLLQMVEDEPHLPSLLVNWSDKNNLACRFSVLAYLLLGDESVAGLAAAIDRQLGPATTGTVVFDTAAIRALMFKELLQMTKIVDVFASAMTVEECALIVDQITAGKKEADLWFFLESITPRDPAADWFALPQQTNERVLN